MNYLKRLADWLWEGKSLYLFIIFIILLFLLDRLDIGLRRVDNIRVYGLLLQLGGTLTIVYSLKEKLILFKGHGFKTFFADYFKRFPGKQIKRTVNIHAQAGGLTFTGAEARITIGPKEEPKDIIRYFKEEIEFVHKRIVKEKNEIKEELNKFKADFQTSKTTFDNELEKTRKLISDTSVSNVWVETFGILTILLGLILGTIPDIVERIIW